MNAGMLMLAAAAGAAQTPACPPVSVLSRTTPIALRIHPGLHPSLKSWRVRTAPGDLFASTTYFIVDGVPTSFHVIKSKGVPGRTRLYGVCFAPWGQMVCARDIYTSAEAAPDVFVRQRGGRTLIVVRYQEKGRRRYEGYRLDQMFGMKKVCG